MSEQDPFIRGFEVVAVLEPLGRRGALIIQRHHPRCDELRVEPEAKGVGASRREYQPGAIDVLAAVQSDSAQAKGRSGRDARPKQVTEHSSPPRTRLRRREGRLHCQNFFNWLSMESVSPPLRSTTPWTGRHFWSSAPM